MRPIIAAGGGRACSDPVALAPPVHSWLAVGRPIPVDIHCRRSYTAARQNRLMAAFCTPFVFVSQRVVYETPLSGQFPRAICRIKETASQNGVMAADTRPNVERC